MDRTTILAYSILLFGPSIMVIFGDEEDAFFAAIFIISAIISVPLRNWINTNNISMTTFAINSICLLVGILTFRKLIVAIFKQERGY